MPRQSSFGKLLHHFHSHPKGRLHEFLFWASIGVVLGVVAVLGFTQGWLSTPLSLMLAVVALCFVGWACLPRAKTRAPPPLPQGKRGEIAKNVRAAKAERKKKDDVPPGPPIRRG